MRRLVALALIVLVVLPGCSRTGDRLGVGSDVDLCAGWGLIDGLDEPDPRDRAATLRWAEGVGRIVDRIDLRREIDDEPVPPGVEPVLEVAGEAIETFVSDLRDDETVAAAFRRLTTSDFDEVADLLTDFTSARC